MTTSATAIEAPRGRLFSFREALTYLGMPEPRLRRLVAARKIPVHRDGRLGFWQRDLDDWMAAHRTDEQRPPRKLELVPPPAVRQREPDFSDVMPRRRQVTA